MRKEEIREFQMMEELDRADGDVTQRELAKRLGISLGMVNIFIKRVVRKGYFKVRTIPGRRMRYLFTPEGFAEKSRLTLNYLRYSLGHYGQLRNELTGLIGRLERKRFRRIAVIGTTELSELFFLFLRDSAIRVTSVVSDTPGSHFHGYALEPLSALQDTSRYELICVMDLERADSFLDRLREMDIPRERIIVGTSDEGVPFP